MFIAAEEWNKAKRVAKELEPRYMLISKQTSLIQRNNIEFKFCIFLEIVCICRKNSMSMLLKNELFFFVDWRPMLMSGIKTVSKTKERQSRYSNSD